MGSKSNSRQIIKGTLSNLDYVLTLEHDTRTTVLRVYVQAFRYAHGEFQNSLVYPLVTNLYDKESNLFFSILAFVASLAIKS